MRDRMLRHRIVLAVVVGALIALCLNPCITASGESESLQSEADRLTYEILELKARQRAAHSERDALVQEMYALDESIAAAEDEIEVIGGELDECQHAYDRSLRSLYKRGEVSELEVFLEARELEEVWEDTTYFERILSSLTDSLELLKKKISELGLRERDLRYKRARRQRICEALDAELIDARIAELEARLSEVNASLRALNTGPGGGYVQPSPNAPAWNVPAPGELLDRVPSQPPLSDFERTGMIYSGYTTCYGANFHGRSTASGVIFNMYDFTCAHRTLPFGTWLLVTFGAGQTIVQVNDRGPFVPGRVLDLSFGAAQSIGLDGVQWTEFEILIPQGI